MRIVLVAPTYLPAHRANTIQVMKMAQAMTVLGHQVLVTVPGKISNENLSWENIARQYGLHTRFEMAWLPVRSWLRRYDYGISSVLKARSWGADYIYTRLPQAAAFASVLGMPILYEVHDIPQGIINPWLFRIFLRGRAAKRLVTITHSLKDALHRSIEALPPAPFTMIAPDGVDLERFADLPSPEVARQFLQKEYRLKLPISQFTVGYTGSLYTGRGMGLILEIANALPDVNFFLIGGSPAEVLKLDAQIQGLDLRNIFLTGFVPNADLPHYQAACEVLLMPYQEKVAASSGGDIAAYLSPMKLFEYMACGRAIISSDLPVLREVLNDENAVLLPPNDIDAWVETILSLRQDAALRALLAENALKDVQQYTWEARSERIFSNDL